MSTIKERVTYGLKNYPKHRDDLPALIERLWRRDVKNNGKDINTMSAVELLELMRAGKLSNPRTIQREWCKIQEEVPELRGTTWKERKGVQEPEVRNYIKEWEI